MLKINCKNIKKYYGKRLLLDIGEFQLYSGDKVGIVGVNGSGKTSFLRILMGGILDYEGQVEIKPGIRMEYVSQLEDPGEKFIGGRYGSIFQVDTSYGHTMSGGEKTRFKLAQALEANPDVLLLDEPTSNLDMDGIGLVIKDLSSYKGSFLLVSHDRHLLDGVCNKILEIEDGKATLYDGNYSDYNILKEEEYRRKEFEYNEYIRERNRLVLSQRNLKNKSNSVRRTPKRMGNSEARLHRMGGQNAKKNLDNRVKSLDSRLEKLDKKNRPRPAQTISIKMDEVREVHSNILVEADRINKSFGGRLIFKNASFEIYKGRKVGLLGSNGSGKTSLINMIIGGEEGISLSQKLKIGYFSQSMNILDGEKTILENVMATSIQDEGLARLLLANLLIRGDRVHEKLKVLSGGEKVKVSLAKIILQDVNFLILDEPSNYLDIGSLRVVEETLVKYDGTILLVSHDRRFLENIVDEVLIIQDGKISHFKGGYGEYLRNKDKKPQSLDDKKLAEEKIILNNRISMLLGQLSMEVDGDKKKILEDQYETTLRKLQDL